MEQAHRLATTEERMSLLRAVAGTVIGSEPVEKSLIEHAEQVCGVFGVDFCVIRRLREGKLQLLACSGIDRQILEPELDASLGIGRILIEGREPVGIGDTRGHAEIGPLLQRMPKVEFASYAGTPMINRGEVVGILGVYRRLDTHEFTQDELDLLLALGSNIAVAVRNHELYEELQAINEDLDARVQARTAELEAANRELEAFTYTVAHDLRTPLRAIVSNSQMLLEDFSTCLPDEAKPMLERQIVSAKRLANMMDGLLALTRIGKHQIQTVQMDISKLAQDLANDFSRANGGRPLRFYIESNIVVGCDPRLMRLLFQNLFENSVKFVKPGTQPTIRVRKDPNDPSISFIVEDEGIGFDMEYAGKVFLPFERLVREDEYPGTGIGLASVKRIVDKHKASVQVKSRPGEGTAFEFRF